MTRADDEIVLTGMGLVTSYGYGVPAFWRGLLAGQPALGPSARFRIADQLPVGAVPTRPGRDDSRNALAATAVEEALTEAGYAALPNHSLVVLAGQTPTLVGPGQTAFPEMPGPDLVIPPGHTPAAGGPHFLSHACASAAFGIAFARELMAAGLADVALVAGAVRLNNAEYANMDVVRALSPTQARPFDRDRDGTTLGEGAGALVLETRRHALTRGARTDLVVTEAACVVGGAKAAASDQDVLTACLDAVLRSAPVDRIDYAHAHATGTTQGDAAELAALEKLATSLSTPVLPVSSHKGAIGHLLHTSGFPALVATALALRTGVLPPTPGLRDPEPTERLRLLRTSQPVPEPRSAVLISAGFGGNNAAVLLRRN